MWQSPASLPTHTRMHTCAHARTRTHTYALSYIIAARSSASQEPLSPPDLQCLGRAGRKFISVLSLLCVTARVGMCMHFASQLEQLLESNNQMFLSP